MRQKMNHHRNAAIFIAIYTKEWNVIINTLYALWRLIGRRDHRDKMALSRAYLPTVRFVLDFFSTRRQCALLTRLCRNIIEEADLQLYCARHDITFWGTLFLLDPCQSRNTASLESNAHGPFQRFAFNDDKQDFENGMIEILIIEFHIYIYLKRKISFYFYFFFFRYIES